MRSLLLILLLTGCTATGPVFNEAALPSGDQSTLVIYRPDAYLGAGAGLYSIDINGETACRLHTGSFFVVRNAKDKIIVSSSIWSDPGTSRISVDAKPKHTYYIKMLPDNAKQVAGVAGGLAGLIAAEGISNTGGPFIFSSVDDQTAKNELSKLKQDCI